MMEFMMHIAKLNILAVAVILFVLVLAKILEKRYSCRWKYMVWLILAVTLLFPIMPPKASEGIQIQIPEKVEVSVPGSMNDAEKNREAFAAVDFEKENQSVQSEIDRQKEKSNQSIVVTPANEIMTETLAQVLMALWAAGACVGILYRFFTFRAAKRKLNRWSIPVQDVGMLWKYKKVQKKRHMKKAPVLMMNNALKSPVLAGIFRPRLYLPKVGYTEKEWELMFEHELCHYRRRDLWYKFLMLAACTVYWFNPFLYLMKREAERDVEFICDETVMKNRGHEEKMGYNQLLLKTASAVGRNPYELSTGLNDGVVNFKRRVVNIMKAGKLRRGIVPVICITGVLVFTNIFVGCSMKAAEKNKTNPEKEPVVSTSKPEENQTDSKETQTNDQKEENSQKKNNKDQDSKKKDTGAPLLPQEVEDTKKDNTKEPTPVPTKEPEPTENPDPEPTTVPTQKPSKGQNIQVELDTYLGIDALYSAAEQLGLKKVESRLFGERGVRYEANGTWIDWCDYSDYYPNLNGIFNASVCSSSDNVSLNGIYCGQDYTEAKNKLLEEGWRVLGNGGDPEHATSFLLDKGEKIRYNISFQVDDEWKVIEEWYWCNWPEGDLEAE